MYETPSKIGAAADDGKQAFAETPTSPIPDGVGTSAATLLSLARYT